MLKVFTEALSYMESNHVDGINPKDVIYGAIRGMMKVGDSEGAFIPAEISKEMQVETEGRFAAVAEYAHRPRCEAGFRDAKWWLGFVQARLKAITAWSRLFASCAIALLVVASLATRLLLRGNTQARVLLRRVASRHRGRCELSLVSAIISLLHQEPGLYEHLAPRTKLKLDGGLANVS